MKGERREILPAQRGEASNSFGVLSRLTRSREMFVFLKGLHRGTIEACLQQSNTKDETKTLEVYFTYASIYPSSPIETTKLDLAWYVCCQ